MKQQRPVQRDIAKQEKSKYRKGIVNKNNYKPIIYTAIGIIGAIALAGFIISGGCCQMSTKVQYHHLHQLHHRYRVQYMAMYQDQQDYQL